MKLEKPSGPLPTKKKRPRRGEIREGKGTIFFERREEEKMMVEGCVGLKGGLVRTKKVRMENNNFEHQIGPLCMVYNLER